jgi:hypothetical protein
MCMRRCTYYSSIEPTPGDGGGQLVRRALAIDGGPRERLNSGFPAALAKATPMEWHIPILKQRAFQ